MSSIEISRIQEEYSTLENSLESKIFITRQDVRARLTTARKLTTGEPRQNRPHAQRFFQSIWRIVQTREILFLVAAIPYSAREINNCQNIDDILHSFEAWAKQLESVPSVPANHQCLLPRREPYLDFGEYNWEYKAPRNFTYGLADINSPADLDATRLLWSGELPTLTETEIQPAESHIHEEVLETIHKQSDYHVYRDGLLVPPSSPDRFRLAARASYQATTLGRDSKPACLLHSVMGIWPHAVKASFMMQPPPETPIESTPLSGRVQSTFVDLRQAQCHRSLLKTIGGCVVTWLLFPPTQENSAIYVDSVGFPNLLGRVGAELKGAIIAVTDSSQELELPAGTLHALFTNSGGYVCGIEYSTSECLPTMSRVLRARLKGFRVSPETVCEDAENYVNALTTTLDLPKRSLLKDALASWIDLLPSVHAILDVPPTGENKKPHLRLQKLMRDVDMSLLALERGHSIICPCGEESDDIANHVGKKHLFKSGRRA